MAGDSSARQDVGFGPAKVRMIQHIERFQTELKLVMFVIGHAEVLVHFGVDGENSRSDRRVSSDIAKTPARGFDEGGAVVPPQGFGLSTAELTPVVFGWS